MSINGTGIIPQPGSYIVTKAKRLPIEVIEWADCTHYGDTSMDRDEVAGQALIRMITTGWLIADRRDAICIGMDYIPEQARWRHVTWLPKANIIKRAKI